MTSTSFELNIFTTDSARRNLVAAYRKSGLSQKIFCEQHGVKGSTFKNWFYRYPECSEPVSIEASLAEREHTLDPSFLFKAITVQEDEASPKTPPATLFPPKPASVAGGPACLEQTHSSAPNIQIDCSVFRIGVPIGFDARTLQNILSIMQALP